MRSLAFAFIMMIATPTYAAEFFILPGTKTLLVMGETKVEDIQILRSHIEDEGIDALILKGPGGSLEAGYAIANIVLEHELAITVPKGTKCASACSLIFAAGSDRIMEWGSRLGFHLPFVALESYDIKEYCRSLIPSTSNPALDIAWTSRHRSGSPDCLMRTYQRGLKDIRRLSKILVRDGISEEVLELVINTPSDKMAWITPTEADGYGLARRSDD